MDEDTMKGILISPEGTFTPMTSIEYEDIKAGVGGYIESIPTDGRLTVWVNEEGKILQPPLLINWLGQRLWAEVDKYGCTKHDVMVGPAVVLGPVDAEGNCLPVPRWVWSWLEDNR